MNNKAVIEFGFCTIRRILQISEGVILLDLQNSSYHTQPLSIIANYFTRWQKLVWYKNKNIYPEKSLYVQFFTIKSNLEKIKYD